MNPIIELHADTGELWADLNPNSNSKPSGQIIKARILSALNLTGKGSNATNPGSGENVAGTTAGTIISPRKEAPGAGQVHTNAAQIHHSPAATHKSIPASQPVETRTNTEDFRFAISLLRVDLMALCLSAGVVPCTLWPAEGLLLNLHLLQEFVIQKCIELKIIGSRKDVSTATLLESTPVYHRLGTDLKEGADSHRTDAEEGDINVNKDGHCVISNVFLRYRPSRIWMTGTATDEYTKFVCSHEACCSLNIAVQTLEILAA
jgi:hypothetical protein